ncbi:MAG: ATP-binding protein [Methanoregulaceae archaeon]
MSVQSISRALEIHRNSAAKYLSILQLLGKVDLRLHGKSKIYRISQRLPFDAILQSYPDDYIIGLNKSLCVIAVNRSLAEDTGGADEQFAGKNLADFPGTGLLSLEVLDAIKKGIRGEEHSSLQEITLENTRRPFIMKLVPTVFNSGMIGVAVILIRYYGVADHSERDYYRKKAEYWETCYHAATRDKDEYVVRSLPDGKILSVNETYARIVNRPAGELTGTRQTHMIPREDLARLKQHFASLTPGSPSAVIEHRIIMPDGTLHWVMWKNRAVVHEKRIVEILSTGHDVTREHLRDLQFKKYEDAIDEIILEKTEEYVAVNRHLLHEIQLAGERESVLRTREEYYRNLVETLTKGMWIFNAPQNAGISTMPIAKMLEFPEDRFRGKTLFGFPGQADRSFREKESGIPSPRFVQGSGLNVPDFGEPVPVQERYQSRSPDPAGTGSGIPGSILNEEEPAGRVIEDRKYTLLDRITRHDIMNQLMVLQGYLHLSLQRLEDPKTTSMVEKGIAASESIGKMLMFTRECQEIGLHAPHWQNLHRMTDRILANLEHEGISIVTEVFSLEIFGDPLFEKVLYNLIENAIRHGEKITSIRISWKEGPGGIILFVEDNGIGIPEDEKEKIFSCGYGKNSGYGMFFAREVLEITGFTIRETGIFSEGARFEIAIPHGNYRLVPESSRQDP